MRGRTLFAIALLCLWNEGSSLSCAPDGPPPVTTQSGPVLGHCKTMTSAMNDVIAFLGVPYAMPPNGTMRFKRPMAAENWTAVRNTTEYKPSCVRFPTDLFEPKIQAGGHTGHTGHSGHSDHSGHSVNTMDNMNNMTHDMPAMMKEDEDCLYLNIFVPDNLTASVPVLIWFPGHERMYDGSMLAAREGIIVVTASFRTGLLGFLSGNTTGLAGNYGLYDQRLAMTWVQENIANFGGDPASVTIAGQGIAGAMVGLHLMKDVDQTLFSRAISMSGYTTDPYFVRDMAPMLEILNNHLKCGNQPVAQMLECLQSKPIEELTRHQGHLRSMFPFSVLYGPTIDGDFVKKDPRVLLEEGYFTKVDYLLGGNKDDGTLVHSLISPATLANFTADDYVKTVYDIAGGSFKNQVAVASGIIGSYFPRPDDTYGHSLVHTVSDYMHSHGLMAAKYHSKMANAFYFRFSQAPGEHSHLVPFGSLVPMVLGSAEHDMHMNHSMDMPMTMAMGNASHAMHGDSMISTPEKLSEAMMAAWGSFVKTGTPTINDDIDWQPFNSSNPGFLEWVVNMTQENTNKPPHTERIYFWTEIVPILDQLDDVIPTTSSPDHGAHTTPAHNHGSHTTPAHGIHVADQPLFGLDLKTASEAILALTLVVCFLFVVTVVMVFINFNYSRKAAQAAKKRQNAMRASVNGAFTEEETGTKM